jgi:tRNA(His) guanylyltransferase
MKAIGDRIKANYENRQRYELTRRTPVIVRVDGRAFHSFTRGLEKPFDLTLIKAMAHSAAAVAHEMQGFKLAYVQSDEASFLLTDYDTLDTEAWFGYVKSKVETISASLMTAHFNCLFDHPVCLSKATFDARAFNIPREEVANYFLWRAMDWQRNSISMYCGAFYSHKDMHGQGKTDQHEMLHAKGKNWATDLDEQVRNGTFILANRLFTTAIKPTYSDVASVVDRYVDCDMEEKSG